ncbi:hypothetical protein B0T18DRAFT_215959 [Schizothecium vesticola]|uniref:Uncharacterized protein n=1 Tax=Schizothecium vesticola TaxID=314040 RepID=A0AA40JZJ6_9PEZI|nr:hypothetical protein B0T18DRAFT_215959 [Schizothecium vesticola]
MSHFTMSCVGCLPPSLASSAPQSPELFLPPISLRVSPLSHLPQCPLSSHLHCSFDYSETRSKTRIDTLFFVLCLVHLWLAGRACPSPPEKYPTNPPPCDRGDDATVRVHDRLPPSIVHTPTNPPPARASSARQPCLRQQPQQQTFAPLLVLPTESPFPTSGGFASVNSIPPPRESNPLPQQRRKRVVHTFCFALPR